MKHCWGKTELEFNYHDQVWGKPNHDDNELFKMLILEGQQAGLSWITILKKLDGFEKAYDNFDPQIIANYDENKITELMNNENIIRNKLKIKSVINNAQAYLKLLETEQSFNDYLWKFVNYQPVVHHFKNFQEIPPTNNLSDQISLDLKKQGFKFVGSTIIYAYLQAIGIINDHLVGCDFKKEK